MGYQQTISKDVSASPRRHGKRYSVMPVGTWPREFWRSHTLRGADRNMKMVFAFARL